MVCPQEAATRLYHKCMTDDYETDAAKIECWKDHLYWRPHEFVPRVFFMDNWTPRELHNYTMVPYFFPNSKYLMCYSVEGLGFFKGFGRHENK